MEEEIHYSTVVSKSGGPPPKEKKEDPTIYSEVKHNGPAATAAAPEADGGAAALSHSRVLAVFLGIISVVLVASISTIIYISVVMNERKVNLRDLTAENEKLITERGILEQQAEELTRVTDDLNRTLRMILKFNTFPVNKYCPEGKCQPCLKDWIMFQEKCYFFSKLQERWKSWGNSRKVCEDQTADLVVIDSLQEQEFISNHTEYYHDIFHGYWLGLYKTGDKDWFWVDGRNDTLRYWIEGGRGKHGPYALVMPKTKATASWDPADHGMLNRFICERDVLIKS